MPRTRPPRQRAPRGFTLVEIVVVLAIAALALGLVAGLAAGLLNQQKRQVTTTRMATIDAAIVQYVLQRKKMPCPADGRLASTDANAGTEFGVADCITQTHGVVAWRALGLSEADATDGWGRRFTFRVNPNDTAASRMNMAGCDPAGAAAIGAAPNFCTACTSANVALCTSPANFLLNMGLAVRNVASVLMMDPGANPNTGAAYVLISHGETGGGGYNNAGIVQASTTTDGTEEAKNYANVAPAGYYVDDGISDAAGATHFDDLVLRPTVLSIIQRAGLGPRQQP